MSKTHPDGQISSTNEIAEPTESTKNENTSSDDAATLSPPPTIPSDQLPQPGRSQLMMSRKNSAMLVIDVQQKLIPHIQNHSTLVWNIRRLLDGANVLNVAAVCTEQYPQGLGSTVPIIKDRVPVDDEKLMFSCRDCQNMLTRLKAEHRNQILLCGIETHVCVQQTALDLVALGFDVWVAIDAVGSRFSLDHETALRRMEAAGVTLTTVESILFEWCEVSGSPEFKRISRLVREKPPETVELYDEARYFPRPPVRYLVQADHLEQGNTVHLKFKLRDTRTGKVVTEYLGQLTRDENDPSVIVKRQGVQSVEATADSTAVSVQYADDRIETAYLPIPDAHTNHPRWKVRRTERHIASEEYKYDYEIKFAVVDYHTDNTFREYIGYEHRKPGSDEMTHVSGVRHIEVSSDGRWLVIIEIGHAPQLLALPIEDPPIHSEGES